jgi:FKBP-type peptidyl-prolyl cis-trans isomerase FklB
MTPRRRSLRILTLHAAAVVALALAGGVCAADPQQPPAGAAAGEAPAKKTHAKPAEEKPPSRKSAASYSLGVTWGEELHDTGVKPDAISVERLVQGLRDGLAGKARSGDEDRENIRGLLAAVGEENHRAAAKFLAENSKKPGVVTTASGLQYQVIAAGSGESPRSTDEVTVNYRGALLDGTEFDSSYKRHEPATFEVDRVIPGWVEALQLMKPGAKWKLFIPPQLAYDLRPRPPIPPGSMLLFDVELISVKKAPPPAATPAPAAPTAPPQPK